jgi:hypothetical protein
MGWLHRHRPVEAIIDPSSGELSMSRIASWLFVCLDVIWVVGVFLKLPHPQAYGPVSSMLAICTGGAFTAYAANSAGRTWSGIPSISGISIINQLLNGPEPPPPPMETRPRVKPQLS